MVATTVVLSTVVGEAMHIADPIVDRALLGAAGVGLDVGAVVLAAGMVATLLRWRMAQALIPLAVLSGAATALALGIAESVSEEPMLLPAVSPLQVPSLTFYDTPGEAVLLVLALGPLVAGSILVWTLLGASLDERRRVRWLALSLLTVVGIVAVMQLVRLLGLVEVGDGFLAALP